jgi:hypothetical protein
MLLGYIVSQRGIEPNPEKVSALERMGPLYFAARREGSAPLPTLEEARALLLDYRGLGGA